MDDARTQTTLLLGKDYPAYGRFHCKTLAGGRTAAAITVGSDRASPSLAGKGDPGMPNEDALLARDDGTHVLLAVADAHFGIEASHGLLTRLDAAMPGIPTDPTQLVAALATLPASEPSSTGSATTLLIGVYDRTTRLGFGLSFGDSSLVVVGARGARTINVREVQYVDASRPSSYHPDEAFPFHFQALPRELVLAFTDGIDQCHYRSPDTSVTPHHLAELYEQTGPAPERYASRLMDLALAGVDGHPGGQDNAALVVSLA